MKTRVLLGVVCVAMATYAQAQSSPGNGYGSAPVQAISQVMSPAPPQHQVFLLPPLRGFVDLHAHPLSNLGFGGKLIYGGVDIGAWLPADPDCKKNVRATSMVEALGHDTSTHGGINYSPFYNTPQCGDDLRKIVIHLLQSQGYADPPDDAHGAPDFTDWPVWNDVTHQKMWVDWIRRAYSGGLRVMVALAVNNKTLGDAVAGPGDFPTDDKSTADREISETIAFVGRHSDFMQIAYSSADLESIVRANKLAVVLGVEIDNIGDLKGTPSNDQISAEVDHLYDEGVRYVFPIHLLDNPFGGTAAYFDLFNFSTFREEGSYWNLGCAPAPANPSEAITYKFPLANQLLPPLLTLVGSVKLGTQFPVLPFYPNCPQTNKLGLTQAGIFAVAYMMRRGMFIDIDHMSDNSKAMAINIALGMNKGSVRGYPLNSGHGGLRGHFPPGIQPGPNDTSERSTTSAQYRTIMQLHGMVGIGSAKLAAFQWLDMYRQVLAVLGNPTGPNNPSSGIAGFGTDLNGMEYGMPPDTEQDNTVANPQYVKCVQGFQCTGSGDTVRRPGQTATNACTANAQSSCLKQFPATVVECVSNCSHPRVQYTASFPISSLGTRSWDYNVYGVAHYGMLADFLQDARTQRDTPPNALSGASLIDNNLMLGADYFFRTWQKIEALKDRPMIATATPASAPRNVATVIVVQATDAVTHLPVPNAVVHVGPQVVPANQPFNHVFTCSARTSNPRTSGNRANTVLEPPDFSNPSFAITAPGFLDNRVEFTISGITPGSEICR